VLRHVQVEGDDLRRSEATNAGCERAPDVPESQYPDGLPADTTHGALVLPCQLRLPAPRPLTGRWYLVRQSPRQRQQHGDRVVGHLGRVDPGDVAREHPEVSRRVEVDRVDAHAHAADDLQIRAGFHHLACSRGHRSDLCVMQQLDQVLGAAHVRFHDLETHGLEEVDSVVGTGWQHDFHRCSTHLFRGA
jgi:hypothetical protein